jgi:hypothetical protein
LTFLSHKRKGKEIGHPKWRQKCKDVVVVAKEKYYLKSNF